MPRQIQIVKKGSKREPAPGTPDNPITSTPSGRPMPY